MFKLEAHDEVFDVKVTASRYLDDGTLAVAVYLDTGELFNVLTVNLEESFIHNIINVKPDELDHKAAAFVDTNNCPWASHFIESNELGVKTGAKASSGWCTYPGYVFDLDKFDDIALMFLDREERTA